MKNIFTISILTTVLTTLLNAQGITNTLGGNTANDKFIVENNSGSQVLTVTGEGNVGIGTTSPISKLHIYDNVNSSLSLRLHNASTGTGAATKLYFDGSNHAGIAVFSSSHSSSANVMRIFNNRNSPDGSIDFVVNGGKKMVIDNTGNVGIGTTLPDAKLHIYDESNELLRLQGTGGSDPYISFYQNETLAAYLWSVDNHFYVRNQQPGNIYLGTNTSTDMTIGSNGNVGIGTTSPDAKLHVEGTVKIGANGLVFSEIMELTGTTHSSYHQTHIAYPTGYNSHNTRILTCEIKVSAGFWVSQGQYVEAGMYVGGHILISHPDASNYQNKPYRMTLMKVE